MKSAKLANYTSVFFLSFGLLSFSVSTFYSSKAPQEDMALRSPASSALARAFVDDLRIYKHSRGSAKVRNSMSGKYRKVQKLAGSEMQMRLISTVRFQQGATKAQDAVVVGLYRPVDMMPVGARLMDNAQKQAVKNAQVEFERTLQNLKRVMNESRIKSSAELLRSYGSTRFAFSGKEIVIPMNNLTERGLNDILDTLSDLSASSHRSAF